MKYIVTCSECDSYNLSKGFELLGEDTEGEREEVVFKCNECNHTMYVDEVNFEIWL